MLLLRDIDCALHLTLGGFIGVESCVALVAKFLVLDLYNSKSFCMRYVRGGRYEPRTENSLG